VSTGVERRSLIHLSGRVARDAARIERLMLGEVVGATVAIVSSLARGGLARHMDVTTAPPEDRGDMSRPVPDDIEHDATVADAPPISPPTTSPWSRSAGTDWSRV
jgi:hypothetical protein